MRLLLTRPRQDAARTALRVAALGHEAVVAPVIEIVALQAALPDGSFEAVLATSANARSAFEDLPARIRAKPFYAVGRHTAEAARAAGFGDVRTSEGDANALVALVLLTLPRPASLLYLAGHDRKPIVETALGKAGYGVVAITAYEARAVPAWPEVVIENLRADRLDGALHYSRRSAVLATTLAERHGCLDAFLRLRHWCLSVDVAEPLNEAGAGHVAIAAPPTEAALLMLLPAAAPDASS